MIARLHNIRINREQISEFCRRHGILRFSLYGSVLREDFDHESDVDVLIEFPPGATPSLLDLGGMQVELTDLFGREVDLKTPGFLAPEILRHVQAEREVQYAA